MKHLNGQTWIPWVLGLAMIHLTCRAAGSAPGQNPARQAGPENTMLSIERITPERIGGQAYKLVYRVNVPIAVFWKFKTDFDNAFLIENKFIRDHRFISQDGNIAITEDQYTNGPDGFFRWQTTLSPAAFRLDFILLNPEQCRQKYHHGYIQLESEGKATRVTQVANFDFWGATLWAYNPWRGGMRDFLSYTARWEQATILRLKDRYHE